MKMRWYYKKAIVKLR